ARELPGEKLRGQLHDPGRHPGIAAKELPKGTTQEIVERIAAQRKKVKVPENLDVLGIVDLDDVALGNVIHEIGYRTGLELAKHPPQKVIVVLEGLAVGRGVLADFDISGENVEDL